MAPHFRRCDGCKCKVEAGQVLRLTRTLDGRDVERLCLYCLQDREADRIKQQRKGAA